MPVSPSFPNRPLARLRLEALEDRSMQGGAGTPQALAASLTAPASDATTPARKSDPLAERVSVQTMTSSAAAPVVADATHAWSASSSASHHNGSTQASAATPPDYNFGPPPYAPPDSTPGSNPPPAGSGGSGGSGAPVPPNVAPPPPTNPPPTPQPPANPPTAPGGPVVGPVAQPPAATGVTADVLRLTAQNRRAPTMMGGWNPALRSIMVMNDGSRWFAAETGGDVAVNSAIIYYKQTAAGWKAMGSVALPAGVQQNTASITDGKLIYSYGISQGAVIEAWFNTAKPRWNIATGNAVAPGGVPIVPGQNANYVGAAWHNGTRVVWWTTTGADGGAGTWSYSYNSGRGWNGPIVSGAGGYDDVSYIRAQFDNSGRMRMIGEGWLGTFPSGQRYTLVGSVVLGNAASWASIQPALARTPLDLWHEDGSAITQYLFRVSPTRVGYWPGLRSHASPTVFNANQARFITTDQYLGLVLGHGSTVEVRLVPRSAAAGPIDWSTVPATVIPLPKSLGSFGLSGIWNVDTSKQPNAPTALEFAVCGGYPARDNQIFYFKLTPPTA